MENNNSSGIQIKVKRVKAVAKWAWAVSKDADECCGICRNQFDACCSACKAPGDECPPVFGKCSHVFHMHCIVAWIGSKEEHHCPVENKKKKKKKIEMLVV